MIFNMVLGGNTPPVTTYQWEQWSADAVPVYGVYRTNIQHIGIEYDLAPADGSSSTTKNVYTLSANGTTVIGTSAGTADAIDNSSIGRYFYYPTDNVYVEYLGLYTDYTYANMAAHQTGTTYEKGSTYYGIVTSTDPNAYPADGEQDGYYYVAV